MWKTIDCFEVESAPALKIQVNNKNKDEMRVLVDTDAKNQCVYPYEKPRYNQDLNQPFSSPYNLINIIYETFPTKWRNSWEAAKFKQGLCLIAVFIAPSDENIEALIGGSSDLDKLMDWAKALPFPATASCLGRNDDGDLVYLVYRAEKISSHIEPEAMISCLDYLSMAEKACEFLYYSPEQIIELFNTSMVDSVPNLLEFPDFKQSLMENVTVKSIIYAFFRGIPMSLWTEF